MRRAHGVMAAALAVALVTSTVLMAGMGGCAARRRAIEAATMVTRVYADTTFENHTTDPVRLTLVVAERTAAPPGTGSRFIGDPKTLAPGSMERALIQEKKPYGAGFLFPEGGDRVVRFKLETVGATWEEPQLAWYEVIGPLPKVIRIVPGEDAPGAEVANGAESGGARIEPVPREWWPKGE